ncbi:MAG TPA: hypothetical protein VK472_08585 [Allosphingosinicella sp.]|nr:hypothetical protein [Allosphingosinicella sp.]
MTLTVRAGNDDASFKPGAKAMANDAEDMRRHSASGWKMCAWAALALLATFLWLAFYVGIAPDPGPVPAAAAPGWPSVSC